MQENFKQQKIRWTHANNLISGNVVASEGDSNGRMLALEVIDEHGEKIEKLEENESLSLAWKSRKRVGLDAFDGFKITYTTEFLKQVGTVEASIVYISNNERIESLPFKIKIVRSVVDDNAAQSSNSFTALTEALNKVYSLGEGIVEEFDEFYKLKAEWSEWDRLTRSEWSEWINEQEKVVDALNNEIEEIRDFAESIKEVDLDDITAKLEDIEKLVEYIEGVMLENKNLNEDIKKSIKETEQLIQNIEDKLDRGEFKGEPGEKGDPGEKGEPGKDGISEEEVGEIIEKYIGEADIKPINVYTDRLEAMKQEPMYSLFFIDDEEEDYLPFVKVGEQSMVKIASDRSLMMLQSIIEESLKLTENVIVKMNANNTATNSNFDLILKGIDRIIGGDIDENNMG